MNDKELEKLLKALSNKRRLGIIKLLKNRKRLSVNQIAREMKLSFKATSRHLNTLFNAGALEREQIILNMIYELPSKQSDVLSRVIAHL